MSTVQQIKAAIPKLTPQEQVELREWLEDFFEDQLELKDEVKTKLDQARQEIREGKHEAPVSQDIPCKETRQTPAIAPRMGCREQSLRR